MGIGISLIGIRLEIHFADESKTFLAGKSSGWKGKGKDYGNGAQKEKGLTPFGSVDKDSCLYCKEKGHWGTEVS